MSRPASSYPEIAYGTPRKLPKAHRLKGRVVVLDIAFAASTGGASFETVTKKFIDGLGERLAMWIDHHDHQLHELYKKDPRFVLATKAEHGACPEMVTPERVAEATRAGPIDTICCHTDFDGLCAAAKWIRGGLEPYPGADADAHAIDTRLGVPSERADLIDRALRARHRDDGLRGVIVRYLAEGAADRGLYQMIREAASELDVMKAEAHRLAETFVIQGEVAVADAREPKARYDKTELLLLGQERALISVVHDRSTVTVAARFDSGVDLLTLFDLEGGMPTRVSVPAHRLEDVLRRLAERGSSKGVR